MNDPHAGDTPLDQLADLPMQPTGSGVADLETAIERMELDEAADRDGAADPAIGARGGADGGEAESEAHPS